MDDVREDDLGAIVMGDKGTRGEIYSGCTICNDRRRPTDYYLM